jgi:hypothetical protein
MVDPKAAVSLAKPSKPADEEKFAPLLTADSNLETVSLWKTTG